ncbi:hypothetical protein GCM10010975_33450 [Comamonas phosphati]|nr:hypothetical protein GCM10010975_33450 [Comamonas phosphati]
MRRSRAILKASAIAIACGGLYNASAYALDAEEIFRRVSPAVVMVKTYDEKNTQLGTGSAVTVAPESLLTNCHVLARSRRIEIKHEDARYDAELVHIDVERDLCQIRARGFKAKPVEIGNSDAVPVGKKVYALGNPRALELTLSDGLVAALRRDGSGVLRYIQTTAPISPGSSGGGLFDPDGKLIGITAMVRLDSQNMNFAVPINMLRDLPERSRQALAAHKANSTPQVASIALPGSTTPPSVTAPPVKTDESKPSRTEEKQVTGSDLSEVISHMNKAHFRGSSDYGVTNVYLSGDDRYVTFTGAISGNVGSGGWYTTGDDLLCFNMHGAFNFKKLDGCYRLFQSGPRQYALRSKDGSTILKTFSDQINYHDIN